MLPMEHRRGQGVRLVKKVGYVQPEVEFEINSTPKGGYTLDEIQ